MVILPFSTIQTECITEYGFVPVGLPADLQKVHSVCPSGSVIACYVNLGGNYDGQLPQLYFGLDHSNLKCLQC